MSKKIALIQMTSSDSVADNLEQAKKRIEEAAKQGAELIVLPEMFCLMGMDRMDKIKQKEKLGQGIIQDFLHNESLRHGVWMVGGTIPMDVPASESKAYAACLLYNDQGEVVARYNKIHLFDVYVNQTQETHSESQSIYPGKEIIVADTPFGKLGLAVCYDLRFPELFRAMAKQGAELIALPAAFTYTTGLAHWETLVRARAIENQVYMLAACQTGNHTNQRKTFGHSMVVNPWGEIEAILATEPGVITAEIDLTYLHQLRKDFPVLLHRQF